MLKVQQVSVCLLFFPVFPESLKVFLFLAFILSQFRKAYYNHDISSVGNIFMFGQATKWNDGSQRIMRLYQFFFLQFELF